MRDMVFDLCNELYPAPQEIFHPLAVPHYWRDLELDYEDPPIGMSASAPSVGHKPARPDESIATTSAVGMGDDGGGGGRAKRGRNVDLVVSWSRTCGILRSPHATSSIVTA